MAGRIQGITIEIDGNTTGLQQSLKKVDGELKSTKSALTDVNKLLKMNPSSITLLTQKQKLLKTAIADTKQRLTELKAAQSGVEKGSKEWDALQREIIATKQDLTKLQQEYRSFGNVASQVIKVAGGKMTEFGNKVQDVGKKLQPLSTAATGALTAIGGLAYKTVQSADELATLSQQTGISTDELQKMQYASDLVDVSLDSMTGALKKLKPKITEDNKTLAELGVTTKNTDGTTRNAIDVFYDAIDALSKVDNETERDQLAMELFGKSADELAGIIDDGGAALKQYGKEAEDLGLIMSGETVDDLNAVNDTIDRLKKQGGGALAKLGATFVQVLEPALGKVVTIIGKVTDALKKLTPEQAAVILKITGIVAAIGPAIAIIGKVISVGGTLVSGIGAVVGVLGGPLTLAIGAAVAAGVFLYKNWDTVKATAISVRDGVVNAFNSMKDRVTTAWNNIKTALSNVTIFSTIKSSIQSVIDKLSGFAQTVRDKIQEIKNHFNFSWSFPHIKLPHFKVSGGVFPYGLGGSGKLPSISIDWYKKAYDNPIMFTSPTVLQTSQGAKGFGDGAGAEIVMGLNKLQELVGGSRPIVVNVYGSQGQSVDALADAVTRRIVNLQKQRNMAYA